jgi:hypothetical protein
VRQVFATRLRIGVDKVTIEGAVMFNANTATGDPSSEINQSPFRFPVAPVLAQQGAAKSFYSMFRTIS